MYEVSTAFQAAIEKKSRQERITGTITLSNGTIINISDHNLEAGGLKIDNQCVTGEELMFGSAYVGQLVFSVKNDIDRYKLYGAEVKVEYALKINADWESIPMGVFYVSEAVRKGVYIKVTAVDNMTKFDNAYDGTALQGNAYHMLTAICRACGVALNMTESELIKMPNSGLQFMLNETSGVPTYRICISYIAQLLCGFATIDRSGGLVIRQMSAEQAYEVPEHQRTQTEYADFIVSYSGVRFVTNKTVVESYSIDADGIIMTIKDNPFFIYDDAVNQQIADDFRGNLDAITYVPSDMNFPGNPAIDCGDLLEYTVRGDVIRTLVTHYAWQYRGRHTIKSVGKNPLLADVQSREAAQIAQINDMLNNQSSQNILYDYNLYETQIGQDEKVIANITCVVKERSTVQGHFVLGFKVTGYCRLFLRFKDNDAAEPFAPLLYDLDAGEHSIGVPHAYLDCAADIHAFTVTAQCTNGTITVPIRQVLFTVESEHIQERVIDIATDVRDFTISQSVADGSPDSIWIVGIEKNKATVRSRSYGTSARAVWTPKYSFEPALEAAIEFDGDWVLPLSGETYTLKTYEQPYVFIINNVHQLWVYLGGDKDTGYLLAEDVVKVSACRGFKSQLYLDQDQGVICAYIKSDGKAYYRNYCHNGAEDKYMWMYEVPLTDLGENLESVQVHRLNDYRIGICGSGVLGNEWMITDRTYVNQAVPPNRAEISIQNEWLFGYMPGDWDLNTELKGMAVQFEDENVPQNTFTVLYKHPLRMRTSQIKLKDYFTLRVNNVIKEIKDVILSDDHKGIVITSVEEISYTSTGNTEISIAFNGGHVFWAIQIGVGNGTYTLIEAQTWTWSIVRPVITRTHMQYPENQVINVALQSHIDYHQLVTNKINPIENATLDLQVNPIITYNIITETKMPIKEISPFTIDPVVTFECTQVGESPI